MREGRSESRRVEAKSKRVELMEMFFVFFFYSISLTLCCTVPSSRLAVMSGASDYDINFKPGGRRGGGGGGRTAGKALGFMRILQAIVSPQMWPFPYH